VFDTDDTDNEPDSSYNDNAFRPTVIGDDVPVPNITPRAHDDTEHTDALPAATNTLAVGAPVLVE